jgi:hypothetical protein
MSKLQEICNEKKLSKIGDLSSKIGNNIELTTLINLYDDSNLLNTNIKNVMYICKALGIEAESLVDMNIIKADAEAALNRYYEKNPIAPNIKKAHYLNYMIIKKACERGNITEDECLYILSEMKNIKNKYITSNNENVREFIVEIRRVYAPYFLRDKAVNKYTEKMRYYQFVYNIKTSVIRDLLGCSQSYYLNFSTGYVDLGTLSFVNAVKLAAIFNTTVLDLFDNYFFSL